MLKQEEKTKRQDILQPLLWVLSIVFVLMIVFSALFYNQCEEILMERTHAYVSGALQQASEVGDTMMLEVTKLCMQMYSGGLIDLFSFSEDANDYYVLEALHKMDNYRFLSSYIKSVYVYSRIQQRVYLSAANISNKVQYVDGFFDEGALALLTKEFNLRPLTPVARTVPLETTGESYEGLTFVFFDDAQAESSNTIMIINVDKSQLVAAWNAIGSATHASILAIHPKGRVKVDTSHMLERFPSAAEIPYQVGTDSAFQTFIIDQQRFYTITTPLSQSGWQYVGFLSDDSLSGDLIDLRNKTLTVAVWILLIGGLVGGISAFRLARPIRFLREKVTAMEMVQAMDVGQLRRSALRRILLSCKEQLSVEEMKRLGLYGDSDCLYRVLLLSNIQDISQSQADRTSALSAAAEQADTHLRGVYAVPMGYKSIAIVIVHDHNDPSVQEKSESLLVALTSSGNWSFTAALSTASQSLEELSFLYNQASQYMVYSLFSKPNHIIYVEHEIEHKAAGAAYPVKIEKEMCDAIENAHFDAAAEKCAQLLAALEYLPPMKLNMASTHLMFNIGNAIETVRVNMFPDLALNYNLDHLCAESNSIADIENRLRVIFLEMTDIYQKNRSERIEQFAAKLTAILEAEYCKSALSLNMIAELMDLTPNYIGRMYKRATGVSILDKIMSMRMERACMLLVKTNQSVAQISGDVGFTGEGYFYKAFKQYNGCTPNDYRRNHRNTPLN